MWAGVWLITLVRVDEARGARWGKVVGACVLFLAAAAARDAVVALVPGMLLLLPGATRPGIKVGVVLVTLGACVGGAMTVLAVQRGKLPAAALIWLVVIPGLIGVLIWAGSTR